MNKIGLNRYSFEKFPKLSESTKEFIGLGSWSMYRLENEEYMIISPGGCMCCHGRLHSKYFILNDEGEYLRIETKEFYDQEIKKIKEIVSFTIPERVTKNYIKFKI